MYNLFLYLCISLEVIHFTRGQATNLKGTFTKGNVNFTWDLDRRKDLIQKEWVRLKLDGTPKNWTSITTVGYFMQMDILKYKTVSIKVVTDIKNARYVHSEEYMGFRIPKVIKTTPGDVEIEIPIDFIPATNGYYIRNIDTDTTFFEVKLDSVYSTNPTRYLIKSRTDNNEGAEAKSVIIVIKEAQIKDAGYIVGQYSDGMNSPGVVLVVKESPTIAGNVNVPVGEDVILTCESNSTSAPSYYKMLPPLTYTWYRNETKITESSSNQWRFRVEKSYKYDTITCMAREEINSERSEPFRLNPQYGPDSVVISPWNQTTVHVIEGGKFGPFTCSADCNPPCTYQWKKHLTESAYDDVYTGAIFTIPSVSKGDADRYMCRAISKFRNSVGNYKANKNVILHVMYLSEPVVYTSNTYMTSTSATFEEKQRISLSCRVEGCPLPQVSIQRDGKPLSTGKHWSNHTFSEGLHCNDTGYYVCDANNDIVDPRQKSFHINVICSTRLDDASSLKINYGSQIGRNLSLSVPVISNPKPNNPTWRNPANKVIQAIQQIKQGTVVYRYVIESSIRIRNQSDFGYYTLSVRDKQLLVIAVYEEGPPFQPLNFSGILEMQGQINLTWISTFSGGPEQFFLLKQKLNSEWIQIANISDIGQGRQMSFVVEKTVEAGVTYEFILQSCNRIDCSDVIRSGPIKTNEIPTNTGDTGSFFSPVMIAVSSSVLVVVVLAVVLACVLFKSKRKSQEKATSGKDIRHGVQVSATENEDNIENQRLHVKTVTDHHEYDMIDEGIHYQNNQIKSSVVPKREQYLDVLARVLKADGKSQEYLHMAHYRNKGGYVGKTSTSKTVDCGKNEYESMHVANDPSSRLYTDLSRDYKPQGSLYTALSRDDKSQSSLYTALHSDHQPRSSVYTSLRPNDEQKENLYTSLRQDHKAKDI